MNPSRRAQETPVLVCLGDSITYGFPYGPESSWVETLRGCLAATPLNRGVNGDALSDMLRRLPGLLNSPHPVYVHILGGTNDAYLDCDPDVSRRCVEKMVELCTRHSATPVLGLPTPVCSPPADGYSFFPMDTERVAGWLARHRRWLREFAAARSIPLIDYYTPLCLPGSTTGDPRFFIDEAHLSSEGNLKMSAVAAAALQKILDSA